MKILFFSLLFFLYYISSNAQSTLPLRADTVVIEKVGGNGEFKLKNSTRDTLGVLTNTGGGRTTFIKSKKYSDTCIVIGRDTICGVGGGSGDANKITGVPVSRTSYATDNLLHGHVYTYNYPDSAFYPQFPTLNKIELWRGSGLKIFGHSLASPSTTPPTRTMHSTLLAQTIGGPDSNLAVGGTNVQDQLKRINQENHLRKGETQSMLLCIGIDNRDDTSHYADRPAYHTAGIFAAVRCHRDTIILLPDMSFTGTWTDFTQGLAAGGRTNGKITSTSGDFYQFQTLGGTTAFITFFSAHPNQDPTNYTDSVVISVDGVYHSSQSMANIGISGNTVPYMGIIFIHDLTDGPHTIRVTNRRNKPMAIDFAGALDYGKNCAPVMCELISPVANIYIGGSGVVKRLRINRLNRDYNTFITENFTRRGLPVICVNPLDGFDPNTHTIDGLHPDSAAQHGFYESIMRQVVIVRHADTLNQWNINGNSNTTSSNFIGTTGNVGVDIRTNGVVRGRFGTNNNVTFMQYQDVDAASSNSFLAGAGRLGANALFGASLCRALCNAQDGFAAGGPGCEVNALLGFATGASKVNGQRGFGLINGVVDGDNGGALGYGAYSGSFFHIDIGYGSDTTGSYLWSKNSIVPTDPLVTLGGARATDGLGGIVGRRTVLRINKSGIGLVDTAWYYNAGKVPVTTTTADSLLIPDLAIVRKQINDSLTSVNITGGTGIIVTPAGRTYAVSVDNTSDVFIRTLQTFSTDVNNSGTSETDLYSHNIGGITLTATGQTINFEYVGTFNDATATAELAFSFAGIEFGSTGALTVSSTGSWSASGYVMRTGTTTGRAYVVVNTPGATVTNYVNELDLTGLDFTTGNILKITGQAGGGGGGSNDITAKTGKIRYEP